MDEYSESWDEIKKLKRSLKELKELRDYEYYYKYNTKQPEVKSLDNFLSELGGLSEEQVRKACKAMFPENFI